MIFPSALGVWGVGEFIELATFPGGGGTSACVVLPDPGRTGGSGLFMLGFLLSAKLLYNTRQSGCNQASPSRCCSGYHTADGRL